VSATATPLPIVTPPPVVPPNGPQPVAVAFWDAQNGLAGGGTMVWRTRDGGETWDAISIGRVVSHLASVRALSAAGSRAWVSLERNGVRPEILARSADGGKTWKRIAFGTFRSLTFVSASRGFAVMPSRSAPTMRNGAYLDGVWTTRDGGTTWRQLTGAKVCGSLNPQSVSFVSTRHGWLLCSDAVGMDAARRGVLETTDGGRTWNWRARTGARGTAIVGAIEAPGWPDTIAMAADGHGFLTTFPCGVSRTIDGGRVWTRATVESSSSCIASSGTALRGGPWFVFVSPGFPDRTETRLLRSDDEGATWPVETVTNVDEGPRPTD
jgi:photosystem II stability/assembly factor-like uncharacterized protein